MRHWQNLPRHRLVVELDADEVALGFGRLEVHPELCVAFRLDVVRDILPVDGDDDFKVAGARVGRVDGEVDGLVDDTGREIGNVNLKRRGE